MSKYCVFLQSKVSKVILFTCSCSVLVTEISRFARDRTLKIFMVFSRVANANLKTDNSVECFEKQSFIVKM
jgi:hypothetical protein